MPCGKVCKTEATMRSRTKSSLIYAAAIPAVLFTAVSAQPLSFSTPSRRSTTPAHPPGPTAIHRRSHPHRTPTARGLMISISTAAERRSRRTRSAPPIRRTR